MSPFSDCTSLTVKVVPGTPIILTCPMYSAVATQPGHTKVSWVMLKAAKPLPITSKIAEVNGTSLSFGSLDGKDKNWYRCNYTLGRVSRCYDINLRVNSRATTHSSLCNASVWILLFQGPMNNKTYYYCDCASNSDLLATPAMKSRDQKEDVEEVQHSIKALAAALTVITAAVAAAAAGFIMYSRCNRCRSDTAEPPAQSCPAGPKASFVQSCSNAEQ